MLLGKVQTRDNSEGLQIIIDGEDEPTTKKYHYLASYVPAAGDRILIEEIGDSYVVLGKVISTYADAGKAQTAENVKSYTGNYNIQFGYFNSDIWARIGNTQFALQKK